MIGRRRLILTFWLCGALGAKITYDRVFEFEANGLHGADILMDEASVTATENAVMAAVLANGQTQIRNAASEPHVQEVCQFLNILGAKIEGIGSNTLHITGVSEIERWRIHHRSRPVGGGELYRRGGGHAWRKIRIRNAGVQHLEMIWLVFHRLGVDWTVDGNDLLVPSDQSLVIASDLDGAVPEVKTNVWPGFPTDLMSIAITVATQVRGSVLFHDWMFSARMYFTDKLVRMGARIILCDPYRVLIQGPTQLYGEKLESPDIRAGMALLLAALAAKGTSKIRNIRQIERGYERVDEKLLSLGARISRETE